MNCHLAFLSDTNELGQLVLMKEVVEEEQCPLLFAHEGHSIQATVARCLGHTWLRLLGLTRSEAPEFATQHAMWFHNC